MSGDLPSTKEQILTACVKSIPWSLTIPTTKGHLQVRMYLYKVFENLTKQLVNQEKQLADQEEQIINLMTFPVTNEGLEYVDLESFDKYDLPLELGEEELDEEEMLDTPSLRL